MDPVSCIRLFGPGHETNSLFEIGPSTTDPRGPVAPGPPRYVKDEAHVTIFMGPSKDELPRYQGHIHIGYEDGGWLAGYAKRVANVVLFDTRTGESINVRPKGVRYSAVTIPVAPYNQQFDAIVCVWRTGDSINLSISLQNCIYISLKPAPYYLVLRLINIPS